MEEKQSKGITFDLSKGVKLFQNLRSSGTKLVFNVVGSWMSEKYDGVRAIYLGNDLLVTCRGQRIHAPPNFFIGFPKGYVFDGELWISRKNFETVSGLARKSFDSSSIWESVKYLVFDVIHSNDDCIDVAQMTFEERQALLTKLLPPHELQSMKHIFNKISESIVDDVGYGDNFSDISDSDTDKLEQEITMTIPRQVYRIQQYHISSLEYFQDFYSSLVKIGAEGVVVIPRGERYRPGVRSNYKLKEVDEVEGVVIDYKEGNGKNVGLVGSFTVKMVTSEGKVLPKTFSIGTGLSQYQRQHGKELYPPGTVLTCYYNGLTSTGVPRFPRLKGVRPDIQVII